MQFQNQLRKRGAFILVTISICIMFAVMQGLHDNYGIMTNSLSDRTGLGYGRVSLIIGIGAFLYGLAQPFMGMLALRKSHTFVMLTGILMIVAGLVLTIFSTGFVSLLLAFGIILPVGTTGVAFGILMGAVTPMIGEKRAAMISGIVQASAGVGDALLAPFMERMISMAGIVWTLLVFALPFILMIPVTLWIGHTLQKQGTLAGKAGESIDLEAEQDAAMKPESADGKRAAAQHESFRKIFSDAFTEHDYRCILIGFSTCGFNMSIIEAHLFNQFLSEGLPSSISSLTLTVYGVMTMLGALATGFLCTKFKMKNVLGTTYLMRVFISLCFILLPKTLVFAFVMTGLLGATGDSTVPPTAGTVSRLFGAEKLALLYGVALVGHQFGALASASLGGYFVEIGWGYTPLWIVNLILAAIAATASYCIHEKS